MSDDLRLTLNAGAAGESAVVGCRLDGLTLTNCSIGGEESALVRIAMKGGRVVGVSPGPPVGRAQAPEARWPVLDVEGLDVHPGLFMLWTRHNRSDPKDPEQAITQVLSLAAECQRLGRFGFTHVVTLGSTKPEIDYAYRQAHGEGLVGGPRLLTAGRPVVWGREGARDELEAGGYRFASHLTDGDLFVVEARRSMGEGADFLYLHPEAPDGELADMDALERAARCASQRGRSSVGFARGSPAVEALVAVGVDAVEYAGGDLTDGALSRLADSGTMLLSGIGPAGAPDPRQAHTPQGDPRARLMARAVRLGVRVLAGSPLGPEGDPYRELRALERVGLSHPQLLEAVTWAPAEAFRRPGAGRVAEGSEAGLLAARPAFWEEPSQPPALVVTSGPAGITFQARPPVRESGGHS